MAATRQLLAMTALAVGAWACVSAAGDAVDVGPPLEGEAALEFLRTADVLEVRDFDSKGITSPRQAILSDGERTLKAVWKTYHEYAPVKEVGRGRRIIKFRDSWRHEVAAYELDRALGIGLVPPTVERTIDGETGALQLWIEDAMTAWKRYREDIPPPNALEWNNRMHTVRAFVQLIWDLDYNNLRNQLIDPDWRIWKIDSSRSFREDPELRKPESLTRFSRPLLSALRSLDEEALRKRLDPWLEPAQVDGVLSRARAIVELADRRVREHGEAAVLYDE